MPICWSAKARSSKPLEPDGLEVLAPEPLQKAMGWPELTRLGFGAERRPGAIPIGLEGDWLDHFGALLGGRGRWSERQASAACRRSGAERPGAPARARARSAERGLAFPGHDRDVGALPDADLSLHRPVRREARGLVWLGFNLGTGAVVDESLLRAAALRRCPMAGARSGNRCRRRRTEQRGRAGATAQSGLRATLEARVRPLLDHAGPRRAWSRFCAPCAAGSSATATVSTPITTTCAARRSSGSVLLPRAEGERAEADRRRETLRVEAIEREYRAKLDDLRHNYALRVTVEWVQALDLYVPVQRLDVLIRRRKGERMIRLDWHPLVKTGRAAALRGGPRPRAGRASFATTSCT